MNDRDPGRRCLNSSEEPSSTSRSTPTSFFMTTKLEGGKTTFLPFNRGDGTGAGNPQNPDGYKTAYLWEQVWQRDSWLDIIARFAHLQVEEKTVAGRTIRKETMIFPRYHQLVAVRMMEMDARGSGTGANYLVQHSAGSGKSNSIAWLAHRLASLHNEQDRKVFDSVIVITDRRVLDRQLQDTIYQFDHKQGVVQKIDEDSAQLCRRLDVRDSHHHHYAPEVPVRHRQVGELPDRKYAVIVDEAHSSQSGEAATELKGVLAAESIRQRAKEEAEAQGLLDHERRFSRLSRSVATNRTSASSRLPPRQSTRPSKYSGDLAPTTNPFHSTSTA